MAPFFPVVGLFFCNPIIPALLLAASYRIRNMEVRYGSD